MLQNPKVYPPAQFVEVQSQIRQEKFFLIKKIERMLTKPLPYDFDHRFKLAKYDYPAVSFEERVQTLIDEVNNSVYDKDDSDEDSYQ